MSARGLIRAALAHARGNVVAYAALFVAVGGTSYAALNLPANSVGARQIRNGSIQPVKLDHSLIAASIRAWVNIQAGSNSAGASAASSRVQVSLVGHSADHDRSIRFSHCPVQARRWSSRHLRLRP
jgi:hypothetical protein